MIFSSCVTTMTAVVLHRHLVEDAHHGERAFAVQRRGRLVGEDHRRPVTSARAIDTRCCSPPESSRLCGGAMLDVQRLQQLQGAPGPAHWLPRQHGQQRHVVGDVEEGNGWGAWKTKPMLSRRSARRSGIFQPSS